MSIVCTLRSPSETRRSRILLADAPGAKGFLSLSIRTATPPRAPTEQPAPGEPGCGSPDLRGLRAQASRLGSVACSRVTFYHSFDKRLVEAFTFKLVPRQWTETRSGLPGGRRKDGPPVTQGRGRSPPPPAGTRAMSQRRAPSFRGLDARRGDPQSWRDRRAALGPFPRPRRVRSARISPNAQSAKNRATRRAARAPRQGVSDGRDRSTGRGPRVGCFGSGGVAIPGTVPDVQGAAFHPAQGWLWGCRLCPPRAMALSARVSVSVSTPRLCR